MATGHVRDDQQLVIELGAWAESRAPGAHVVDIRRPTTGWSNETCIVDLRAGDQVERLVFRLAPLRASFPGHDLAVEAGVQRLLTDAGFPVPAIVAVEDTFLVMEFVAGRTIGEAPALDPWLIDATLDQQRTTQHDFVDALARLHHVDWSGHAAAQQLRRGVAAEIEYWKHYLDWSSDGAPPPMLRDAINWCATTIPASEPAPALLWGDARLGNTMWNDERQLLAFVDWELATLGPPEMDVAWYLVLDHLVGKTTGTTLPGFDDRVAFLARYGHALGRPLARLAWHEIFALIRSVSISDKQARLAAAAGIEYPAGFGNDNPMLHYVAHRIDKYEERGVTFDASPEHSPMSGIDEYLVHNYPHPVRVMWTTDAQAYERIWFTAQDQAGELLVVTGMGIYPNLGTAEAFAIVNHRGRHTTVRAHRLLGDNRMDMRVGPISFEVVEPFREWRLALDDNDYGTSYDIRWFDTKRAVFRNLGAGMIAGGKPFGGVAGYDGFGNQSGWVAVDGQRTELTPATFNGTRDHHWGTRDGVGGRARWSGWQHTLSGAFVEFPEWSAWGDHLMRNLGDPRPGSSTLRRRRHRLRFDDDSHLLLGGEVDMHYNNGDIKTMTFERLGNQIAFLRCGMYGGPNGGTPDGDIWHGEFVGDGVVSGETFDANDPAVRARICGLDQHHMRFECEGAVAYGLFESYDPLCYEVAGAGREGLSLLDG